MIYVTRENSRFKAVRSSGPGGQNVNKRATKVRVWVKIGGLLVSEEEKDIIREKLAHRINKDDELAVSSEEERSQEQNHDHVLEKINVMIANALAVPEPRISTEAPEGIEEKFREIRKLRSLKKKYRYEAKNPKEEEINN